MEVDAYGNYTTIGSGAVKAKAQAGKKVKTGRGVDPTTFSVVWNKFESILDEVGEKVLHATQSFPMQNVRDLGQVLLDAQGQFVTVSAYLPCHTFTASVATQNIIKHLKNDFHPGDFIIGNDPYIVRSGHLPDWTHLRPIFYKNELIGFFQFRGHVADTGGFLPGGYGPGAYDIVAEGLNIPPLKILKKGVLNKDAWELLLRNVRNPTQVEMDAMLVNGTLAQAEQQIVRLCDKYGLDTVKACMKKMIDAGERAARAEIAKMPDGVYYGAAGTDWDGQTDKPIWVRLKVIKKGSEITFDLSESDPQATFVNSPMGNTVAHVMIAFYSMINPSVPKNHGSMKPIHIIAPEGSISNPRYPATVGASAISIGAEIVEACWEALGKAISENAMGAWSRHCCPVNIGMDPDVIDPRTGTIKQYLASTFGSDGSAGAVKGYDGWHGLGTFVWLGNLVRPDIEIYESQVPFRVLRYELVPDWEGAGEFRGGAGVFIEAVADTKPGAPAILMSGNCDGQVIAPHGPNGEELHKVEMWIECPKGEKREFRTMTNAPIFPGERYCIKGPGGGGLGHPLNRDIKKVQNDVIDGLVSIQRAREVYGVVLDPKTLEIQYEASRKLRDEMRAKKS